MREESKNNLVKIIFDGLSLTAEVYNPYYYPSLAEDYWLSGDPATGNACLLLKCTWIQGRELMNSTMKLNELINDLYNKKYISAKIRFIGTGKIQQNGNVKYTYKLGVK